MLREPAAAPSRGGSRYVATWALICLLLAGCNNDDKDSAPAACAQRVPDFSLPDLAGRPHHLQEYLDRPVLLFFFTSWCPVCRSEIPLLKEIERDSESLGVRLVAVAAGLGDTSENVRSYVLQHRLPYVVLYDDGSTVSNRLGVKAVPAAFLIGTNGCMVPLGGRLSSSSVRALLSTHERG